jgi:hypothetical protein
MIIIQILIVTIQKIRESNIMKLVVVKEMLYYIHTSELKKSQHSLYSKCY